MKNTYIACTNMVKQNNIQGLSTSADAHLIKDTEWGAVVYLTQSEYGNAQKESEEDSGVWNNSYCEGDVSEIDGTSYCTTRTGMVGVSKDDSTVKTLVKQGEKTENAGVITITYKNPDTEGEEKIKTFYEYWTGNGVKGSTTGTIYGIYDLSGGAWECLASYNSSRIVNASVQYFNNTVALKHKIIYHVELPEPSEVGYAKYQSVYGNAKWETSLQTSDNHRSSWDGGQSYFMDRLWRFRRSRRLFWARLLVSIYIYVR